jgi:diguanylate cyclase (GGDEF)-like protein/PAS domain S-box-containing protein
MQVLASGEPNLGYEEEVSSPVDGSNVWLRKHKVPLKDSNGKIFGVLGMYEDITEFKKDQLRIARLAAIVEASDDAIIGADVHGVVTEWNKGAEKIYGFKQSEIIGQPISVLAPPDKQEEVAEIMAAIEAGRHIDHYETRRIRKNGEQFYVSLSISAIVDKHHKVAGFSIIGRDVTERKKSEADLHRYHDFIVNIEDACFEFDLHGRATFCNEAACRMLGYTREEYLGLSHHERYASREKADRVYLICNDMYRSDLAVKIFETELLCKDGSEITAETLISKIRNEDGVIVGFRGVGRNITTRKKAQMELERYRDFIENISDGCFELDLKGNFTFMNEVLEKRLGYEHGSRVGLNNRVDTSDAEFKRVSDVFSKIYSTGEPATVDDYVIRDHAGHTRYITMSVSLMRNVHGTPIGFRGTTRDNTERKRIQNELEQSESRYRNMFQYNKAIMLLIDPETGDIVDANLTACKYYQYSREELLSKKISDLNALTPEEVFEEMAKAELEDRSHFYFEHRLASGEIHPVEVFSGPVEVGGKRLLYSIIHDITDRRKAEEAMRFSEEKYRTILETISEGYLEHDLAGNFLFANDAACDMIGCSHEDVHTLNYRRIVSEETARKMFSIYHEIYMTGIPQTMLDFEIIRCDGGRILLEINAMLMRNNMGVPTGFRVVSRDVTARRRAEEDLRRSEERYRSILDSISEGYFESNLAGDIVFANDSGCAMIGYDRAALYQINYRHFSTPETKKRLRNTFGEVFKSGDYSKMDDYEIIRQDGTIRIHQLSVGLIRDAAGEPMGFRTVARDVTEKKQAEESLRRSEEKYRSIMDSIMEGYIEHDLEGNFIFANDAACTMMGYPREELMTLTYKQIVSSRTAKTMKQIAADIVATGAPQKLVDYEVIRKDGTRRIHQHNLSLIRDAEGKPKGLRVMGRDVTELKWAEEALRQSEERIRLLFRNIPVPTFVWKAQQDQCILSEFNSAAFQFIGDKIIDSMGKPAEQFFAGMPQIAMDIHKCMDLWKNVENQFWYTFDDRAEKRYVIVKYAFAPPDSVLMHVNDITGQKRAEENLQFISIHDSLTGLFNRFYADAEISRLAGSRLRPVSTIVIDLNNLKKINDEYGHAQGDLYIKNSANILKQTFRPDDMIARVGGDEFLVLLPLVDESTCAQAVERLFEYIKLFNQESETPISLSAGFATTQAGDNLLERIREADQHMYQQKAAFKATGESDWHP